MAKIRPREPLVRVSLLPPYAIAVIVLSWEPSTSLHGVSATSPTNAWAVGNYCTSSCPGLIVHWKGTRWSKVTSSNPSPTVVLNGVSATSATNAWAVGNYCGSSCSTDRTLIVHWNGTSWSTVTSLNPSSHNNSLNGVSATSATNAWAVGNYCVSDCGSNPSTYKTLILHWNGTSWSSS